jgi:predicted ATPase
MRVYFVGSHATGKTTLCRYVSRRYGLPMISEMARAVLAEMETSLDSLRTDMDLVAEYQERVFARQVEVERMHHGRFVSDRAFDNLAYAAEHTTVSAEMLGDPAFAEYMKWVSAGVVFFLRPHPSLLREDGTRAGVSWDSVLRIDGMIKLMLEQYRVSYLPVESVSMQERVRAVEFVLARCGLAPVSHRPKCPALPLVTTPVHADTSAGPSAAALAGDAVPTRPNEAFPPALTLETWPHALRPSAEHES